MPSDAVLEPFQLKGLRLKNRIMRLAMTSNRKVRLHRYKARNLPLPLVTEILNQSNQKTYPQMMFFLSLLCHLVAKPYHLPKSKQSPRTQKLIMVRQSVR